MRQAPRVCRRSRVTCGGGGLLLGCSRPRAPGKSLRFRGRHSRVGARAEPHTGWWQPGRVDCSCSSLQVHGGPTTEHVAMSWRVSGTQQGLVCWPSHPPATEWGACVSSQGSVRVGANL